MMHHNHNNFINNHVYIRIISLFLGLILISCCIHFIYYHIENRKDFEGQYVDLNSVKNHKIEWTDSILEEKIRNIIDKQEGDIYLSDIWNCTNFELGRSINADDLSNVHFVGEPIKDISNLDGLENLKSLQLNYNEITDINVLSSMKNLRYLQLNGNPINNISVIGKLPTLYFLNLRNLHLQSKDLEYLAGLKNLRILILDFNDIENLDLLENIKLISLTLRDNQISDITSLLKLDNKSLNFLDLQNNHITNIEPLSKLNKLQYLNVKNNQIKKLPDFSKMLSLQDLDLSNNQITTEEWKNIKLPWAISTVDISGNPITDLETEREYPNLKVIFN